MTPCQMLRRCIFPAMLLAPLCVQGAQWTQVRKDEERSLAVDSTSVKRTGDRVSFRYLVDYTRPQGDFKTGFVYRSLVVSATIRCKARSIALGNTEAYGGPAGEGVRLGLAKATPEERRAAPLEAGSSDEDLWAYLCGSKPAK